MPFEVKSLKHVSHITGNLIKSFDHQPNQKCNQSHSQRRKNNEHSTRLAPQWDQLNIKTLCGAQLYLDYATIMSRLCHNYATIMPRLCLDYALTIMNTPPPASRRDHWNSERPCGA